MKYINTKKLKDKIKSLQCEQGFEDGEAERGYQSAIKDILDIITSLQQEMEMDVVSTAKVFLDTLSKTPYNNKPITDAQIIVKQLLLFFETPSKYNPDAIMEQPEVDLEKEFNNYIDSVEGVPRMWHSDEQIVWAKSIAKHFFELGLNTRKEESK